MALNERSFPTFFIFDGGHIMPFQVVTISKRPPLTKFMPLLGCWKNKSLCGSTSRNKYPYKPDWNSCRLLGSTFSNSLSVNLVELNVCNKSWPTKGSLSVIWSRRDTSGPASPRCGWFRPDSQIFALLIRNTFIAKVVKCSIKSCLKYLTCVVGSMNWRNLNFRL